jgi:hypothetical protein
MKKRYGMYTDVQAFAKWLNKDRTKEETTKGGAR